MTHGMSGAIFRVTHLLASFSSAPKATTVLMEDRTSPATVPADAYAFCSRSAKEVTSWDGWRESSTTHTPSHWALPYPSCNEAGCDDNGNDGQQQESQPPVLDEAYQKPSKERCHPLNQYDQFVTNASMDLVYAPGEGGYSTYIINARTVANSDI